MIENTLSTTELISIALKELDEDQYWKIIAELHRRGSTIEFDAANLLSADVDPIKRRLAADILGQLGLAQKVFQEESVDVLIRLLDDADENVIYSAACSLGHRNDIVAVPFLIALINHKSSVIRLGVASSLGGIEDEKAIHALIELSRDVDSDVRDWATFGLGSLCEFDSDELRSALLARITDEDPDVRGEALVGLAERSDPRILKAIVEELNGEWVSNLVINAAGLTKSPLFVPILKKLRLQFSNEDAYFLSAIDEAIDNCSLKLVKL